MAQTPRDRQPRERNIKLSFQESRHYVSVAADSALVSSKVDDNGALLQITFTRVESAPVSETIRVAEEASGFRVLSSQPPELVNRKIIECTVILRPDHALQVATALMQSVSNLPEHAKRIYNLAEISFEELPVAK
jgi:hypothetical protein